MSEFTAEDLVKRTHTHLNTYITTADQKASILLTAQFAFLGFYGSGVSEIWKMATPEFKLLSGLTIASGLIAAVLAGLVVYPRSPKGGEEGLVFWESIIRKTQSEFEHDVSKLDDENALRELIEQNHSLAKVADKKYRFMRYALITTAIMMGLAAASTSIYFT